MGSNDANPPRRSDNLGPSPRAEVTLVFAALPPRLPDLLAERAKASGDLCCFRIMPTWNGGATGPCEVVAQGLGFDLLGLAGDRPVPLGEPLAISGLDPAVADGAATIGLIPGPHLASSRGLPPVLRTLAALGGELGALPGVIGIIWEQSRTCVAPDVFARLIRQWLDGGAFPAMVLTALLQDTDRLCTRGLDLWTGFELELLDGDRRLPPVQRAKIALRLIDRLATGGGQTAWAVVDQLAAEGWSCEIDEHRAVLRICDTRVAAMRQEFGP